MGLLLINDGGFKGFNLLQRQNLLCPLLVGGLSPLCQGKPLSEVKKDFLPSVHMHRNFATIVLNDFVCGRPGHN
jgi:hypothetical protein